LLLVQQILKGENTSLELLLVNALADQINGSVLFENNNGAKVTIRFPFLEVINGEHE